MGQKDYSGQMKGLVIVGGILFVMNLLARGPSIGEVPEYIDTERGRPFLFFLSNKKIVVRECDPQRISPEENACEALPERTDFAVEEGEFGEILKSLLLLEEGNYTPEVKRYLERYRSVYGNEMGEAMSKISRSKEEKGVITDPGDIVALLDKKLKGERICSVENLLPPTGINAAPFDNQKIKGAVQEVEKRVRYLREGISSAGLLLYVSPKEENQNFSYNLLNSYLKLFSLSSPVQNQ